jgi:hypothetical protein
MEVIPEPINLTTIMETNDQFSNSPFKFNQKMSKLQQRITEVIAAEAKNGEVNLNAVMSTQRLPKKLRAQFFYEVLSLNFKLQQDRPDQFSDIIIKER